MTTKLIAKTQIELREVNNNDQRRSLIHHIISLMFFRRVSLNNLLFSMIVWYSCIEYKSAKVSQGLDQFASHTYIKTKQVLLVLGVQLCWKFLKVLVVSLWR